MGYPIWGFAQEYALLGFAANRLEDAFPTRKNLLCWVNGFLMASAHLPNPMLTAVTFASGTVFTYVFYKHRHLIPLALVHALFGILLSLAFSDIPGLMSVGPAYLSRIAQP